jgi:hypothetical protein
MPRDRTERVAITEAAYRIANERMHAWPEREDDAPELYFCECGTDGCRERLRLAGPEYEAIRSDPRHFGVLPGHVIPDLETVVEEHEGYLVIEKPTALLPLLEETDPRAPGDGPAREEASELADRIAGDDD